MEKAGPYFLDAFKTAWKVALYGLLNGQFMTKVNHKTGKKTASIL